MKNTQTLTFEYSLVSAKSLMGLLKPHYDLPEKTEITFLHQGFNDTYLVSTSSNQFILRVYRAGWKSLADIEGEVALLTLLNQHQVSVSYPISTQSGGFVIPLNCPEGTRYAVLFTYASGKSIPQLDATHAKLFGNQLARVHQVTLNQHMEKLSKQYTVAGIFNATYDRLKARIDETDAAFKEIQQIGKHLESTLDGETLSQLTQGVCHGDPHYENAFFGADTITLFDFDFCGNGYLHYDLGSFYWYERESEQNNAQFLEGYTQVRSLSQKEIDLIPYFVVLMRIYHLGARAKNADGIRNPIWPSAEIGKTIQGIAQQLSTI